MSTGKTKTTTAKDKPPDLVKRIGKTTYRVRVHFSTTSKETMSDKILRLIQNESAIGKGAGK